MTTQAEEFLAALSAEERQSIQINANERWFNRNVYPAADELAKRGFSDFPASPDWIAAREAFMERAEVAELPRLIRVLLGQDWPLEPLPDVTKDTDALAVLNDSEYYEMVEEPA